MEMYSSLALREPNNACHIFIRNLNIEGTWAFSHRVLVIK